MPKRYLHGRMAWKVMQRNAWKDIANLPIKLLSNWSQRHARMIINSKKRKMNPWENCLQSARKLFCIVFFLARIGRPDILWSVNKLACAVTKWSKACDKRIARVISYIHHTREFKQYCHVGSTAQQCRLGLFRD